MSIFKSFTDHPAATGENYMQHLWFTVRMSARFQLISLVLLAHGIMPFLFTVTASSQIARVYEIMRKRKPKSTAEDNWVFEI